MSLVNYRINKVGPINDDGSQQLSVDGRHPFHVDAGWLARQPQGVQVGDTLTDVRGTLTLMPAAPVEDAEPEEAEPAQKKTKGSGKGLKTGSAPINKYSYRTKPLVVAALKILSVADREDGGIDLELENGEAAIATPAMISRMSPELGDYWVMQPDGYVYLNPKDVFERKYEPVTE